MSQCLEHFVIIRGPGVHHQAETSSGMLRHPLPLLSPATAYVPTGEVPFSEKGSECREEEAKNP